MLGTLLRQPIIGITFTRNALYAANAVRNLRGTQVEQIRMLPWPNLHDRGENNDWVNLTEALRHFLGKIAIKNAQLRVALPMPLAPMYTVNTPERPKNLREAEAMIRLHAASVSGTGQPLRAAVHVNGRRGTAHRLVGVVAEESLCRAIESIAARFPVAVTLIDTAVSVRNNQPLTAAAQGGAGAVIDVLDDYWILTVRDETGWPVLVKSKWRGCEHTSGSDAPAIAHDVLRLLTAYAEEEEGQSVSQCALLAELHEMDAFREALTHALGMTPTLVQAERVPTVNHTAGVIPSSSEVLAGKIACAR